MRVIGLVRQCPAHSRRANHSGAARDGLDPNPGVLFDDNDCNPVGPATLDLVIGSGQIVRCASQGGVDVEDDTHIENNGELLIITPNTSVFPGFGIDAGGNLKVYSEDLPLP